MCVCVLMIVVIGLSVIFLTLSMIACPDPGFFVSTSTTPLFSVTKIVVVAPGALLWLKIGSWYRFGRMRSSCRLMTGGALPRPRAARPRPSGAWPAGACWARTAATPIAAAPAATTTERTTARFMPLLLVTITVYVGTSAPLLRRKKMKSRMNGNLVVRRGSSCHGVATTSTATRAGVDPTCANQVTFDATQSTSRM